jgi:hypothetical protein
MEKNNNNLAYISIIAVVAVVGIIGLIIMVGGGSSKQASSADLSAMGFSIGGDNLVGDARFQRVATPVIPPRVVNSSGSVVNSSGSVVNSSGSVVNSSGSGLYPLHIILGFNEYIVYETFEQTIPYPSTQINPVEYSGNPSFCGFDYQLIGVNADTATAFIKINDETYSLAEGDVLGPITFNRLFVQSIPAPTSQVELFISCNL